jgi:uncharacterized protein (DUF488 family)
VGVYQSDLDDFLDKLTRHRVAILLDVRQRRGVRGREYAWANSRRLQATLKQAGIEYWHLPELAPTEEYRRRYLHEVLDQVDLRAFLESLPDEATSALLCVERDARACHRSLIAGRLQAEYGVAVVNL